MNRNQRGAVEFLAALIVLVLALAFGHWFAWWSCEKRWAFSGLTSDYEVGQGCVVRTPDGRWIPDDRVRDTDLAAPAAPATPANPTPR